MSGDAVVRELRRRGRAFSNYLLRHVWPALASMAVGMAGVILTLNLAPRRPSTETPGETTVYGWGLALGILGVLLVVLGFVVLVTRSRGSRAQRIERLGNALQEAEGIIAEINREMREGADRLAKLERQTAMHEELAELSSEKAAAIRDALKAELGHERQRSLWRDLALVLLGAVLAFLQQRYL